MIDIDTLKYYLEYDPSTGLFFWLVKRQKHGGFTSVGEIAGDVKKSGYRYIGLLGRRYRANRLAWFYMTGRWPDNHIDHIDGNPSNDRFINLRDVSRSLNLQNQKKARKDNKSGFPGVEKRKYFYVASIGVKGRKKHLGCFKTAEDAHNAFLEKKMLQPGFVKYENNT